MIQQKSKLITLNPVALNFIRLRFLFNVRSHIKSHVIIYTIKFECLVKEKSIVKTFKKQNPTWKPLINFYYYMGSIVGSAQATDPQA